MFERWRRVYTRLNRAAKRYDSTALVVLRRILALRESRGLGLEEAYFAGLLDPSLPPDRVDEFVGRREFLSTLRAFNAGAKDLVDDKAVFAAHATSHGLPIPRTLAFIAPRVVVDDRGRALLEGAPWLEWFRTALPPTFVFKPTRGMGGHGVDFYERRGDDAWTGGRRLRPWELRDRLCMRARGVGAILQERVTNHASLAELSGTAALQCTRIVTVLTRSGGVELLFAFQKLITGRREIDNLVGNASDNMIASIDLESGLLGAAFVDGAPCAVHPDTGRTVTGFGLPDWRAACELARRAARCFEPVRAVGWDVALTPSGPILIEGNSEWFAFGEKGFWYSVSDLERLRRLL